MGLRLTFQLTIHLAVILFFYFLIGNILKFPICKTDPNTLFHCRVRFSFSGNVDLSDLLSGIDDQIVKAKELALSRKDILDKVEKWKYASDEENWLDDYEKVNFLLDFHKNWHISYYMGHGALISSEAITIISFLLWKLLVTMSRTRLC